MSFWTMPQIVLKNIVKTAHDIFLVSTDRDFHPKQTLLPPFVPTTNTVVLNASMMPFSMIIIHSHGFSQGKKENIARGTTDPGY